MEQSIFQKRFSALPCAFAIILFCAGIGTLFIDNAISFIAAFIIICGSAIYFFTGTKVWVNTDNNKTYNKDEVYLKKEKQVYIENLLAQKDYNDIIKEQVDFCSNLKMDVWTSRDKKEKYIQLFVYIPHEYKALSEMIKIS